MKKEPNWVIGLFVVIIILQLLTNFPIQVNIDKTITDCPEVICKEVVCKVNVNIINKTVVEYEPFTFENSYWGMGITINSSS